MKGPAKGMRSGPNHNQKATGMSFAEVDVRGLGTGDKHGSGYADSPTLRLGYGPDAILDSTTFRVRFNETEN